MRLTLWLRVWGAIFALGAIDFLVLPRQTVEVLDAAGARLGFPPSRALEEPGFWVPLAAAYMLLIAVFSFRREAGHLLLAKVASCVAALGWFLFAGLRFPFLAAGAVDAAIAIGTALLMQGERRVEQPDLQVDKRRATDGPAA
jgi:hypothetical protein